MSDDTQADVPEIPTNESASPELLGDEIRSISQEMETCYLDYAMSVIVARALPDIRDGLKPVHRRILYAMQDMGLRSTAKYKKSARIVGDVLGKYHPHGDTAVYEAMVRLAQDFSLRYPLVQWQGNFGSIDGDGAAAPRYTEARMAKISDSMLADIDKETVDFRDNYDTTLQEPTVLPTRIPNLLLMGSVGIAVGMATNIPPHNLTEVVDAVIHMIQSSNRDDVTIKDLMQYIKWPDFPTWGIIYNNADIETAYATGRGSVIMRGKARIDELKNNKSAIIIEEVPYQVKPDALVMKVADLVRDKQIVGISDIRNESNKESIRVVIELKKDAFPKKILNQLYKMTTLQTSFGFNMIALHKRGIQPKLFNLKDILLEFVDHRVEVVTRRTQYELKIAKARAHILEWLKIALDNIDAVIETIKKSKDKEEASQQLQAKFKLSVLQAQAILEMQLQRLSGLERKKIEDELAEKMLLITDLEDILAKPERINAIIIEELEEIKEKYGDDRRTEIHASPLGEFNPKDTIPNEDMMVVLSKAGYIKRIKAASYRTQKRGGKWVATATKDEDEVRIILPAKNHDDLWFFTSNGRVFQLPTYELPEAVRTSKWQPIINFVSLQKDEEISTILLANKADQKYLFLATQLGTVKRLERSQITNIRQNGLIVMKVKDGDKLGWVKPTSGEDNIILVSKKGQAIQFNETDARAMGRAASGVRGIRLKEWDRLVTANVVSDDVVFVMTVAEKWLGKISEIGEYRSQNRGGSGIKVGAITAKTGNIIGATMLGENDRKESDIVLISRGGQTVRMPLKGIRKTGRVSQWVILTKLKKKDDILVSMSIVRPDEDEDK